MIWLYLLQIENDIRRGLDTLYFSLKTDNFKIGNPKYCFTKNIMTYLNMIKIHRQGYNLSCSKYKK